MRRLLTSIMTLAVALYLGACQPGNLSPGVVDPEEGVATNITLSIYSDGWGNQLDATTIATEGSVVIDVYEEQPYSDPAAYYIYAEADGYYTELYNCIQGDAIDVDLDAVPDLPGSVTGVIFATQGFFSDCYYANQDISVTGPDGDTATIRTDAQGRYGLGDVPTGTYTLSWSMDGESFSFDVVNTAGTDYQDLSFREPMQMAAPNLYLYPPEPTTVKVQLDFPIGGHVTESEPLYRDGWKVRVGPDGWIDDEYGYLFYETSVPQRASTDEGWLIDGANLEQELRDLLHRQGFRGREIDDFIEFWVHRLEGKPYYAVYPQDAAALVTLTIQPPPDQLRRVLFLIRPLEEPISIQPPRDLAPIRREGFVAMEWGVLVGI